MLGVWKQVNQGMCCGIYIISSEWSGNITTCIHNSSIGMQLEMGHNSPGIYLVY